jgi:hypothetical protein
MSKTGARRSREERTAEWFEDQGYEQPAKWAESRVAQENRLLWALYRDLDVSQSEAIAFVDPLVPLSQSTASRVIREEDMAVLEGARYLAAHPVDELHTADPAHHTEDYLEAYRDAVAEAVVDLNALQYLGSVDLPNPEWAKERYPSLVGEAATAARAAGVPEQFSGSAPEADTESVNKDVGGGD